MTLDKQPDYFTPETLAARQAAIDQSNEKIGAGFHGIMKGMVDRGLLARDGEGKLVYTGPDTTDAQADPVYEGSQPLFDMPAADVKPNVREFEPNRRAAAGSIPRLISLDFDPKIPTTLEDEEFLHTANLRSLLWHNNSNSSEKYVADGVALQPETYKALVRNVPSLARSIGSRILSSRSGFLRKPDVAAEAEYSGQSHALERQLEQQSKIADGFDAQRLRMHELLGYLDQPGFAKTTESRLLMLTSEAVGEFDTIIDVSSRQMGLNGEAVIRLKNTVRKFLATGPQANRIENWTKMTRLAMQYSDRRRALFANRSNAIQKELGRLKTGLEKLKENSVSGK